MEDDSGTQKEKHDFKDVEIAKKILNEWGYSLDGSIFKGSIYHVRPMGVENEENYPIAEAFRAYRPVAIVDSEGILSIKKPKDDNPILIEHQKNLRNLVSKLKVN